MPRSRHTWIRTVLHTPCITGQSTHRIVTTIVALFALAVLVTTSASATATPARDCSGPALRKALSTRAKLRRRIHAIDKELSAHDKQMKSLSEQISTAQPGAGANPIKRRRLERLLRESRSHAKTMEQLNSHRRALAKQVSGIEVNVRVCLSDSLVSSLEVLVEHVRSRHFREASRTLISIRKIEGVLNDVKGTPSPGTYPEFSDAYVEDALADPSDRRFLADAIKDLFDQARADSASRAQTLATIRKNLALKRDLIRLVRESKESSFDGSSFFEGFGDEQVRIEIAQLRTQVSADSTALAASVRAVSYYRLRLHTLQTGSEPGD